MRRRYVGDSSAEPDERSGTTGSDLFVPSQGRLNAIVTCQCETERDGIFERLSRTLSGVRQHRMRGIAKQRDAADAPVLQRIALVELVEAHVVGRSRRVDLAKRLIEPRRQPVKNGLWRSSLGRYIAREQRQVPVDAVLTCTRGGRLDAIVEIPESRESPKVRASAVGHAAHGAEPAAPRGRLGGMQRSADAGADPVRADHRIRALAASVLEMQRDATGILSHVHGFESESQCAVTDRSQERAVEIRPQRDDGRPANLRVEASQHPPVETPNLNGTWHWTGAGHRLRDLELAQRRERVRREQQPKSQLAWGCRPFEDSDFPAGTLQRYARGEAADPGADDQGGLPGAHVSIFTRGNGWK